jgi:N-dimethylarginine dimethylaminohydrolase
MHRPGAEVNIVNTFKRLDNNAFGDEQEGWYWRGTEGPDLEAMQAQHDAYTALLREQGVEVVYLDEVAPGRMKSCYTRDSVVAIDGGAIVMRLGPRIRRGEELPATRTLARLGCPILRTISGTGVAEGGSFAWLNSRTAVIGLSSRVNEEGANQVAEVLRSQGVELIKLHLTGYRLHIDGLFVMIAPDLALANITLLPHWFLQKLKELKIHLIEVHHEDDGAIINSLAIAPGRVIMPEGISGYTRERLERHRVEVLSLPYDKMISGGGGLHCSTAPLIRDGV